MKAIPGRDIRSILFDLDGVLTRTAAVHSAAWKRLFDAFLKSRAGAGGDFQPFTASDYRRYVDGRPRHEGVKTSPWSATRCLDLTRFISRCAPGVAASAAIQGPA